ncbi:DUF1206 domain-containing protein [Nocardioides sp. GCM10027113]|uniref:DUF1206 domain-containing protein n=1 Tax=unclassified Nocardioides TaxID=2615069 RepID=UPI00360EE46B
MGDVADQAKRAGREAHESDWFEHAVRFGLVTYGVVHVVIAWIALQLAFGDRSGKASSDGALNRMAQEPFGELLIWLIAGGMFVLVAWRLLEASVGHRDCDDKERIRKRLGSAGKAVIYGAIGVSAMQTAIGAGSKGGGTDSTTKKLMDLPAGTWIVGAVGLGIIAYGVVHAVRAWTGKVEDHLTHEGQSGDSGTAYLLFGKIGYQAKGIAIAIVGGLFIYAAMTHDPKKSGGLDVALQKVLQQPFGQFLLAAIALGIGCYGLFCFARARHLSR